MAVNVFTPSFGTRRAGRRRPGSGVISCCMVLGAVLAGTGCGDQRAIAPATPIGTAVTPGSSAAGASASSAGTRAGAPPGPSAAGAGAGARDPQSGPSSAASANAAGSSAGLVAAGGAAGTPAAVPAGMGCPQRMVSGEARLHFHHVHFNSTAPAADIEFYLKYFDVKAIDFCIDAASGVATPAVQTDRGYLLFTTVAAAPDKGLNTYLEHIGWANPNPTSELRRQMMLGVPLWPPGDFRQCEEVAQGMACQGGIFYYVEPPNGARIEVSNTPGPSTTGFAHLHLNGEFPDFYARVLGEALQTTGGTTNVDGVNLTNTNRQTVMPENAVDSKGKPIDHLGFSTADIDGTLARITGEGIEIADPLSFKPEYGFRSFMVKSPEGVWLEIVEDSPFR
jgi:catechol 2,3-dioxygenase-like lactoylglutathione lyase family enzyme